MPSRLTFDFSPRPGGTRVRRADELTRVLVIADLSGDAKRSSGLASARALAVDVDNFDPLLARIRPQAIIPAFGAVPERVLTFQSLDDFHPDQLFDVIAASIPATTAAATPAPDPEPTRSAEPSSPLESLLGGRPVTHTPSPIDQMLQALVTPHLAKPAPPGQAEAAAATSAAIGDELRRVLHSAPFQRVEAVWRGLRWLIFENALASSLQVYVLDTTRAELVADLRACAGDLERTQLHRAVVREQTSGPGASPFALVIGDLTVEGSDEDVSLLAGLGAVAAQAGGCFLAGAEPALWGCKDLGREPERGYWSKPDAELSARMDMLRTSAVAPFIGLCMPRVLGRMPYGPKSDPVERLNFSELPPDPPHQAFLWINGAFACAQLILAGVAEQGWDAGPGSVLDLRDLPHALYRSAGGDALKPCAEVYLDETSASQVLSYGLMPLMSYRNRNAVRLARLQSIAKPAAALALRK